MDIEMRNETFEYLYQSLSYEENNKVFALNASFASYYVALGKLTGFCLALGIDYREDDEYIMMISQKSGRVLYKFKKQL